MKMNQGRSLMLVAASLVCAATASGEILGNAMTVRATSSLGTGEYVVRVDDGEWNGDVWSWNSSRAYPIYDQTNGNLIGTLDTMVCRFVGDPQINVDFAVTAAGADTQFEITSGLLDFADIPDAQGRATSAITVTDNRGNGVTLNGGHANNRAYRSNYNGIIDGGVIFQLLNQTPLVAGNFDSNTSNEAFGYASMGLVSDMQAQYKFTLSARDQASGTSSYVVIPAPAGAGVLALAGLATLRRRR